MRTIRASVICLFILLSLLLAQTENLILNSSFEDGLNKQGIPKNWGTETYGQSLAKEAMEGDNSLKISRLAQGYSIGAQILAVEAGKTYTIMGYIKGENIKNRDSWWQGAKMQIVFMDEADIQIGEPFDVMRGKTGTFDWEMFIKDFNVPAGVKKVKILLGLWNAKGSVWFDDIRLYQVDKKISAENILNNGDFERWGSWLFLGEGEATIKHPGRDNSSGALYVKNNKADWTFSSQRVLFKSLESNKLELSGYVKYSNILPGQQKWQKGRVYVEFKDELGNRVGDWLELIVFEGNSNGWQHFSKKIILDPKAVELELFFGLQDASGEIIFDDLILKEI